MTHTASPPHPLSLSLAPPSASAYYTSHSVDEANPSTCITPSTSSPSNWSFAYISKAPSPAYQKTFWHHPSVDLTRHSFHLYCLLPSPSLSTSLYCSFTHLSKDFNILLTSLCNPNRSLHPYCHSIFRMVMKPHELSSKTNSLPSYAPINTVTSLRCFKPVAKKNTKNFQVLQNCHLFQQLFSSKIFLSQCNIHLLSTEVKSYNILIKYKVPFQWSGALIWEYVHHFPGKKMEIQVLKA